MLFDFLQDIGNYAERNVDCYEKNDIFIDTSRVSDAEKPYETGIVHPRYNDGKMIIVEYYDTKEEAQKGHDRWVALLTSDNLPTVIQDVSTAEIAKFCDIFGKDWSENRSW